MTIPNTGACSVAGVINAGVDCTESVSKIDYELSRDEFLDFLSPKKARTCVPKVIARDSKGRVLRYAPVCADDQSHGDAISMPKRAGAVCESSYDWTIKKTALEQACRELGKRCSYEIQEMIREIKSPVKGLQ